MVGLNDKQGNKIQNKTKEFIFGLFETDKARKLAREVDEYLYNESPYHRAVEDYHVRCKDGIRTDCIGYISNEGSFKFLTLTEKRKVCLVLHLGRKRFTEKAIEMQKDIDDLLGRRFVEKDKTTLTPGEAYIRLEWVDNLEQIKPYIDEAYGLRLMR
ncbi:hypothetical protein [Paenibacillus mucilaginosus]|uniref:hypothetical protein n=1 Tax=Paenibacillus mucilaginosus TaxID=61624 RepID=UPI003D19CEFF